MQSADDNAPTASPSCNVVAIRTHFVDQYLIDLAHALGANGRYRVVFAVDERHAVAHVEPFDKVSITLDAYRSLGLNVEGHDVLWRCGDYVFYLVRSLYPEAPHVWLLENDVLINFEDVQEPFRRLDDLCPDDLLATHLAVADPGWFWHATMADRHDPVYRCFFPLVRLSGRAIDLLAERRRADNAADPGHRHIPNDEAFVATELIRAGYGAADMNDTVRLYDSQTFDYNTLFNRNDIHQADDLIYHPVRTGASFAAALRRRWIADSSSLLDYMDRDAELGFGDLEQNFLQQLDAELSSTADEPEAVLAPSAPVGRLIARDASQPLLMIVMLAMASKRLSRCIDVLRQGWLDHQGTLHDRRLVNIALGKPASQSSTCAWSAHRDPQLDARGANDGRIDVYFGCHTDEQDQPWWQVDLLQPYPVAQIRIYNRWDLMSRLDGYEILCSLDGEDWDVVHRQPPDRSAGVEEIASLQAPVVARHLRLRLAGRGLLHVREIEVYGANLLPTDA